MLTCWKALKNFIYFRRHELETYKDVLLLEDKRTKRKGTIFEQLISGPLTDKREKKAIEEADVAQAIKHFLLFLKQFEPRRELPSIRECKKRLCRPIPEGMSGNIDQHRMPTKRQRLAYWELIYAYKHEHLSCSFEYKVFLRKYIRENAQ